MASDWNMDPLLLAETALALATQKWTRLGLKDEHPSSVPTSDLDTLQHRITALLAVRCAAIMNPNKYKDLSIHTICRYTLKKPASWPLSDVVMGELSEFVRRMLQGYKEVPYHNREHASHVVLSICKLIELMIGSHQKTHGLRSDGIALLALVFGALVHDVEHQGIPNRQLAMEDDRLAVLYNDQSMAENWSLYVAFSEFLQDEFINLRAAILPDINEYRRFRKIVINLVLCTDIASPERTQIGKSKWKEAFGDPFETVERKLRETSRRGSMQGRTVLNCRGSGNSVVSHLGNSMQDLSEDSLSGTPDNSDTEETDDLAAKAAAQAQLGSNGISGVNRRKLERRMSATRLDASKYRQRLGILRTVDLSGETLETYERRGSMQTQASAVSSAPSSYTVEEEPDDLKAAVVMETMMTAADVAHNLQGWEHMVKWSGRLYMELRRAYVAKRGSDPQVKWFENQTGFLESYLLPIARRLEDTGVFAESVGQVFAEIVEANRDRWLTHGMDEAQKVIAAGEKKYALRE